MYIKNIKLKNFRNYIEQEITLQNGINLFYGNNAQGKTNIIESIPSVNTEIIKQILAGDFFNTKAPVNETIPPKNGRKSTNNIKTVDKSILINHTLHYFRNNL